MSPNPSQNLVDQFKPDKAGVLLSLLAALIWPFQAAVIAAVLSGLLAGGTPVSPLIAAIVFFALAALRAAIEAGSQYRLSAALERQLAAVRGRIVTQEARAAGDSALGNGGALAALLAEKLEALRPYFLRYRPARLRSGVMPVVILALALWHSWAVAVVLLMAGPLIPLFMALVGWAAKEASARQMGEIGQLSDLLIDRLAALSDLKLIGAGPALIDGFSEASDSLRHRTMAVLRIAFLSSTVLELFAALGVAMVAVWVGFALLGEIHWGTWGAPLTPFAGIFLLLMAPDFFQPLRDLAAAWHDKAAAEAVLDELAQWQGETRPDMLRSVNGTCGFSVPTAINLRDLSLVRGGHELRYPDLSIPLGESLAIIGESGSGKSSLLRLLAGLERAKTGAVLLDQTPLERENVDAWRQNLGWMPQAPHFLNRSLRYNIGFGQPVSDTLLEQARLTEVVASLPSGLQAQLGENGAGLSGGEARRVMLARALHGHPAVLLADEPTADLDPETARFVLRGLLEFSASGGTLIVATHDPNLIRQMDHVLDLGKGGRHE
ncbi:MAG: thiol reductant ABC exporter subunit CydD [Rhodobacteraceae bacterium]|nr:thiol reductant ABC exporter subunit CydD [Paracoccaceae bacterium]